MSAITDSYAELHCNSNNLLAERNIEVLRIETREKFGKSQCISCGEVQLRVKDFHLVFICGFCGEQTEKLGDFLRHSLENHLYVQEDKIQTLIKEHGPHEYIEPEPIVKSMPIEEEEFVNETVELEQMCQQNEIEDVTTLPSELTMEYIKEDIKQEDIEEGNCEDLMYAPSIHSSDDEDYAAIVDADDEQTAVETYNIEINGTSDKNTAEVSGEENNALIDIEGADLKEFKDLMAELEKEFDHKKERRPKSKRVKTEIFQCEICDKVFKRKSVLKAHMNRHNNIKPYACDLCDMRFVDATNFKVHRNRHLGIKPFLCNFCGKAFTYSTELQSHLRFHTKEKPYECEFCKKRYATHSHLSNHRKYHTQNRPHKCEVCDKRFYDKDTLRRHQTSHSSDRPYKCPTCNACFKHPKYLASHKKVHSGVKHRCEYCTSEYTQSWGLTAHMKKQHPEKLAEKLNTTAATEDNTDN